MFGCIFYALLLGARIFFATATITDENSCDDIEPYDCNNLDPYKDLVILWHHEKNYLLNLKHVIQTLFAQSLGVEKIDYSTLGEGLEIAQVCLKHNINSDTYMKCYKTLVQKLNDNYVFLHPVEHYRIAFLLRIIFSCRLLYRRVQIYSRSYYGRIPTNFLRRNEKTKKCERLDEKAREAEIKDFMSRVPAGQYFEPTPWNGRQLRWIIAHKMTSASHSCKSMMRELKFYIPNSSKDLPYVWVTSSIKAKNNIKRLYLDFVGYSTFNLDNYEKSKLFEYVNSGHMDASVIHSQMIELIRHADANELNDEESDRFRILIGISVSYEKLELRVKAYLELVLERIDVSNVSIRKTGAQKLVQ